MEGSLPKDRLTVIGYSSQALVVADIVNSQGMTVDSYCDNQPSEFNPLNIRYLGSERDAAALDELRNRQWLVTIGDNTIRERVTQFLNERQLSPLPMAVHRRAVLSSNVDIGAGTMIAANCCIQAAAKIGRGVICNTQSTIEHHGIVGDFSHIAPGAVLTGQVVVGERTLVGANAVVNPGVRIGSDVTVGSGAVVIRDVPDGSTVVGNPARVVKP